MTLFLTPPLAFLHALRCSTPSPFHPSCSFLWTLQLCCSPFRRHEYLQLCMFESLWWARDSHHRSAVCMCLCARPSPLCVRECIHLCVCVCLVLCKVILIILTSQCPILGERQARDGGETGWERERERRGRRDVLPPRQTPFIWTTESDQWFPQASAALAGRRLKQHFGLETTKSIYSACRRITLLEWRTGCFIIFNPSSSLFIFGPSFIFFNSSWMFICGSGISLTCGILFSPGPLK